MFKNAKPSKIQICRVKQALFYQTGNGTKDNERSPVLTKTLFDFANFYLVVFGDLWTICYLMNSGCILNINIRSIYAKQRFLNHSPLAAWEKQAILWDKSE